MEALLTALAGLAVAHPKAPARSLLRIADGRNDFQQTIKSYLQPEELCGYRNGAESPPTAQISEDSRSGKQRRANGAYEKANGPICQK